MSSCQNPTYSTPPPYHEPPRSSLPYPSTVPRDSDAEAAHVEGQLLASRAVPRIQRLRVPSAQNERVGHLKLIRLRVVNKHSQKMNQNERVRDLKN